MDKAPAPARSGFKNNRGCILPGPKQPDSTQLMQYMTKSFGSIDEHINIRVA